MSELKSTLVIAADASGVETGVQSAKRSLSTLGKAASDAGKIGSQGLATIGDGGDVAAKKVDVATNTLIRSIQRTTTALEGGGRASVEYYKLLASQHGIDASTLAPYLAQLDQVQKKQALANVALQSTVPVMQQVGMSAKATAAAIRNVPAQFTDIVTSLQGGQSPLTVLLQQGGQLKDMFGGVGGAVRALGTYALGLVNPFTLAAGAVVAIGLAYNGGAKEATDFSKALILSGNAAGTTVNQFLSAQKAIANVAGTKGNAAEALQALASTGQVAGDNLERFGTIAVQMQRVAGVAFADTASAFASLAKTPLEASLKLNDSLHYLTTSTYEQIKALQERGKIEEAGALAQKTYATASESAIKKLNDNMGTLDRAVKKTTDFFKGLWDAAFDVGRPESLDDKLKAAEARLDALQNRRKGTSISDGALLGATPTGPDPLEIAARNEIQRIREERKFGDLAATNAAAQAKSLTNRKAFDDAATQYQSDAIKRAKELAVIENLGAAGNATPREIAQAKAAINAKYDSGASLAAIQRTETQREEIVKRAQSNIDTARSVGVLNEIAGIEATNKLQLDSLEGKKRFVDQEIALAKRKQNPEKELVQLRAQLYALDEQITTQTVDGTNAVIAAKYKQKTAIEAVIEAERAQFEGDIAANLVAESKAREQGRLAVDAYAKSISEANDLVAFELGLMGKNAQARDIALSQYRIELALKEQIKAIDSQAGFDESDRIEQRAKASAAAAKASANVLAKSALDEWTKASDSINASLTDAFLNAGQSGLNVFQSLAKEAENIFKNLVLRPAISAAVQPFANTVTSALGIGGQGGVGGQGGIGGLSSIANLGSSLGTSITSTIADILPGSISAGLGLSSSSLIASNALLAGGGASGAAAATAAAAAGNAGALGGLGGAAAIPGVGWAIAGIALLASLGGGGFKSSSSTGNAGAVFDPMGQRTSSYVVDATTAATESVINGLQGNYASTAARLGIGTVATQFNYGGNTGAQGENPNFALGGGALRSGSFYQGETKLTDAALSLASSRAIFAALQGSDLPKYLTGVFDSLDAGQLSQDQITAALSTASAFKSLHDSLQDLPFAQLKDLSYTAAAGLAAVSGGLDKFQTNLASYYDKFYSDAEQTANTTASVSKALAGLGLVMPTLDDNARAAYRALVEGQDVTTTAGQQAYATLLSISGAFDQIATAADSAAKASADLKSAWQSTTDTIFDEVKRIRGLSGTSTSTLASAQAQFAITNAQASAGDQAAAKLLPSLSQAMLTLAEASATSLTELRRIQGQTAASLSTTGTTLAGRYGLNIPAFDVGTNLVPQDMLALIHKGEAIVPAAYNPALSGGRGNDDLIAEVRALRDQVAQLQASAQDTATHTRKAAQVLVRVTHDGEAMQTQVAV